MFQSLSRSSIFAAVAAAIVVLVLPLLGIGSYFLHIMILVMVFSIFAVAYNLVTGYLGLKTFGHHAFFGLGAYGSALISIHAGLSPWISLWLGAGIAAIFGLLVGLPVLRLKSMPHVAIVTLAFAEIVRIACSNLKGITRGELGLGGIPPFVGFDLPLVGKVVFNAANKTGYYYLAAALLALTLAATAVLLRSKIGLAIFAVREGEDAAESLGVNLTRIKLLVFGYSAFVVGIAGGFYAHYISILTPSAAIGADLMIMIIAMVLVGGLGSFAGPMIGVFLLTSLGEYLRFLDQYRLLVYGAMIILCVMFVPKGLSSLGPAWRRLAGRA